MLAIFSHVANATGELDNLLGLIDDALERVIPIVESELRADMIDIVFVSASEQVIPEYGIGGYTPGSHHIYISFDPSSEKITLDGLIETLLHEVHHAMRWRDPGYGETLGEALVSEGLACLYEAEHRGGPPIYAATSMSASDMDRARRLLDSKDYNHYEWFYGTGKIARWFGYSYGYKLCKAYADKHNLTAAQMVSISAQKILATK